jgi:hypothetical protein
MFMSFFLIGDLSAEGIRFDWDVAYNRADVKGGYVYS